MGMAASRFPHVPTLFVVCAGLVLTACGDGDPPAMVPPEASAGQEVAPGGDAPEAPPKAATQDASAPAAGDLPLTPGVYVTTDTDCARPPNAGFRVYDGRGLSGSATRECRATVRSREGDVYRVDQSCVDTFEGERTTAGQTLRIPDARSFTLTEDGETTSLTFRLCPAGDAPSYLEDLARPG